MSEPHVHACEICGMAATKITPNGEFAPTCHCNTPEKPDICDRHKALSA